MTEGQVRAANVIARGAVKCLSMNRNDFVSVSSRKPTRETLSENTHTHTVFRIQMMGPVYEILQRNMATYRSFEEALQLLGGAGAVSTAPAAVAAAAAAAAAAGSTSLGSTD